MIEYILFILGFILLIYGANFLVDGSSSLAKRLHISDLVIGLTIVALGTSLPELVVNIYASFMGKTDVAIGNILGSNSFNILLILGISAIIHPFIVSKGTVWKEIPLSLLAALMVGILANDSLIDDSFHSALTRIDGLVLLSFFIIFMFYIFEIAKRDKKSFKAADKPTKHEYTLGESWFFIILGLIFLFLGGGWVVNGAVKLAKFFGVSETLIALTIVTVGTSLPELTTSLVAAYKKNCEIAVGNIVGSNIFNIFLILGISSVIRPLPFRSALNIDVGITILASVILFATMFTGKRSIIERWEGMAFVFLYIIYIVFLILRG